MQLARKRALDFYLGGPLLACLQLATRVLGDVLRRNHATEPIRSILIVKFQGLGSMVIAKPAIAELRRRHPEARLIFWGGGAMRALAEQMPELDQVFFLDDRNMGSAVRSALVVLLRLWRERLDWAVDLEVYSRLSSVLVTLTCARNRIGFALDQVRARRMVHTHLVYFNRHKYLGCAYERIIGQLLPPGTSVETMDYGSWRFDLSQRPAIRSPYIVFNIHAGDLSLERRWPKEAFDQLINALLEARPDASALLIGYGRAEVAYCSSLAKRSRLIDLSGQLSLPETFRVIRHAELTVTNDSSPLHFALATRAKVVALFGPTIAETYVPPDQENTVTVQVPLYCSPCVHYWEPPPCNGDNQCMKRLSVAQVLAACLDVLHLPPLQPGSSPTTEANARSRYVPGLVYTKPLKRSIEST